MRDFIIRDWQSEDKPALKTLWQTAFGDSDEYIGSFFDSFLRPGACVAAEADGKVVSAMYIIPGHRLFHNRGKSLSAGYTYALATLPEYRGRGIGAAVYKAASDKALAQADAACVLPAEAGLYPFYEKASGAAPMSYIREARFTRAELKDLPRSPAARFPAYQYAGVREQLLSGYPHAVLNPDIFDHLEENGCEFFVLEHGLAAAETENGGCLVHELISPRTDGMDALASLAAWCPAEEYVVRTPLFFEGPGEARPFMLAALRSGPTFPLADDLWWGFGLD